VKETYLQRDNKRYANGSIKEQLAYTNKYQSGFSLIEVMIAAFVLSIGILGIVGLQALSVKGTHQSFMRHQATYLVHNIAEKMRANIDATKAGSYVVDSDTVVCATSVTDCATTTATCTETQLATYDLNRLICGFEPSSGINSSGLKNILSGGKLEITCQTTTGAGGALVSHCDDGRVNIKVSWLERALDKAKEGLVTPDIIELNTRIAE